MNKRIVACLLAVCLMLSGCAGKQQTDEAGDGSKKGNSEEINLSVTPALQLRVNEKSWITEDLTPYLGNDYTWVSFPVEISDLVEGYNQLAVHSNCYSHGNLNDKTLDIFYTSTAAGMDTSFSQDMMTSWEMFYDRYANIILELYDGENWTVFPEGEEYRLDDNMVIGIYTGNNSIYNICRNIQLGSLEGYKKARVSVLVHVGTTLMEAPEPEPIDEGAGVSELDSQVPVLKVKLNGAVFERLDLTPYLGSDKVWVDVPLDVGKLRSGTNFVTVDSNVDNTENYSDQSVDLYFTPGRGDTDSQMSKDRRIQWITFEDRRYANIRLQLHNSRTGQWETFPRDTKYKDNSEHCVIGMFRAGEMTEYYNIRRGILIEDIAAYDEVKAQIELHVGGELSITAGE